LLAAWPCGSRPQGSGQQGRRELAASRPQGSGQHGRRELAASMAAGSSRPATRRARGQQGRGELAASKAASLRPAKPQGGGQRAASHNLAASTCWPRAWLAARLAPCGQLAFWPFFASFWLFLLFFFKKYFS